MSQQPPRQVSPDGRYYWDGQRWLPVEQQALVPATGYVTPIPPVAFQPQAVMVYTPRSNSMAVTSLVFGIVSWFLCPLVGGIVAVITGHIAHSQIRQTGESGRGLATAGLILGYIHLAASALFVVFWILVFGGLTAMLAAIGASAPSPSP